jgi:hypothetical protein
VPFTISWDPVPSAQGYGIRRANLVTINPTPNPIAFPSSTNSVLLSGNEITDTLNTTDNGYVNYEISAIIATDTICRASFTVPVRSDDAIRRAFQRVIVPVAGSVMGAFGAPFKTSLRLTVPPSSGSETYTGSIVFHPSGAVRDDDPSMPYSLKADLTGTHQLAFDDVVAAMGQHGIGTLDVVPDAASLFRAPLVEARIYTPAQADTFTGVEETLNAQDAALVSKFPTKTLSFVVPDPARFRVSVGVRTIGADPVIANVIAFVPGAPFQGTLNFFAPNTSNQMSLESFVKFPLNGGEFVRITFTNGNPTPSGLTAIVPYYAITNNVTNDTSIFVGVHSVAVTDVSQSVFR